MMIDHGLRKILSVVCMAVCAFNLHAVRVSLDLRNSTALNHSSGRPQMMAAAVPLPEGELRRSVRPVGSADVHGLVVGDELSLLLFEGIEVDLELVRQMESPLGGRAFLAEAMGYDGIRNAVVLETVDGLLIDIHDYKNGRVYTVVSDGHGVTVKEIDPNAGVVVPSAPLVPDLSGVGERAVLMTAAQQSATCIDILVAFDQAAKLWAESNGGGITNFATVAVQKMNIALGNTGLDESFRFRLVGVTTVAAKTDNLDTALRAATDGTGDWAPVKAARDAVGADIVSVLIDTGSAYGTTGKGWSLKTTSFARFSESAYNVCAIRSVAQSHTMTHECGHNLGAGHSDVQADSPGPQLYDYSSGFYFKSGGVSYHTIMAYDSDGYSETHYREVPFFSSPNHLYEGVSVGDSQHDNSRTIAQTYVAATQWRNQVVPESYDVMFEPGDTTAFDDALSVSLTPGKNGLAIRYTIDGSAPTLSSPLYSGSIVVTDTTTIKAATVTGGVLGPVFQAKYLKRNIGMALNAPQLVWTTSPDYPWVFQMDSTFDGESAVQSAPLPKGGRSETWLSTEIDGPTMMSFRYRTMMYASTFSVSVDSTVSWSETERVNDWSVAEVAIPEGRHTVRFSYAQGGYYSDPTFCGIWLDTVQFDVLSRPPSILPQASFDIAQAYVFERAQVVVLSAPEGHEGKLYYTLDGGDPAGDGAQLYDGPIMLTESALVKAVFVEAGKEPSRQVGGYFLERHRSKAGEWTTNIDGALEAVAQDGKLLAILCANVNGCGWSQALEPIARSAEFTAWAEANGIYLVSADTGRDPDASGAYSKFSSLFSQQTDLKALLGGYIYYPTFVFTTPADTSVCTGAFVARYSQAQPINVLNGVTYDGTLDSLIRIFSSALGVTPLSAPVISPNESFTETFPVVVTLSNPNGMGTIYYTLDGSAPTPTNGTRYTGAITVQMAGQTLRTAVWPTAGGISSPIAVKTFADIGRFLGVDGVVWTNDAALPWAEYSTGWIRGGKDLTMTSGTKTSTLRATVTGPGKFVFDYAVASGGGAANIVFKENGTEKAKWYSGNTGSYVVPVASAGTTTFEWIYTYVYYDSYDGRRGAIGNVKWVHTPAEPTLLVASDGEYTNGVFVAWQSVPGASSYTVYRCVNEAFQNPVQVKTTTKTSCWDETAENGVRYWYRVKAVNDFGESAYSVGDSGWRAGPLAVSDVGLPTAFSAVAYSHQLTATGGRAPYRWSVEPVNVDYWETRQTSSFALVGTAKGWKGDDSCWVLDLPFAFPFYGGKYAKAYVSSNGTIAFDGSFSDYSESEEKLKLHPMIAVMWDDLTTAAGDISVAASSEAVTIRWNGTAYNGGAAVNFSATLGKDGTIRLAYGNGNTGGGMIGLSSGDGTNYALSSSSQKRNMGNASDIVFRPPVVLPDGLTLNASGLLSGTTTKVGVSSFRLIVADANGTVAEKEFDLTVALDGRVVVPASVTGDRDIAISMDWVTTDLVTRFGAGKAATFNQKFGTDFASAVLKPTGKTSPDGHPLYVWQDYVAGTDPTDPKSRFRVAGVSIDGGDIKLTWEPDLKSARKYVEFGAETPTGGSQWVDLTGKSSIEKRKYHYRKVKVEMP